ncbi:MAG: Thiamine-monophosphate kinase [Verrucomicrobiota bacterium]
MSANRTEGEVIARLRKVLRRPDVTAGIGDDCAAVPGPRRGQLLLLKTDCVVERRHFRPADAPASVGWKAACRAVSDIAACGGQPVHALVTCVVRPSQTGRWLEGLYRGLENAGRAFGFHIVGGEMARTDGPAVISVAMTGQVARCRFIPRSGGRPGDVLFVTGRLGGSLKSGWHLRFRPRLLEAQWLAEKFRPRAMMDLSDGLAADLPRLAAAGGTGFTIDPSLVPRRRGASLRGALEDGEDFELLLAMAPRQAERLAKAWPKRFPLLPLTCIGTLARRGMVEGLGSARGFDHFSAR